MLNGNGQLNGSVSGGCVEDDLAHIVIEHGIDTLCPSGSPRRLEYGVTAEEARRVGLPCGGTLELLAERLGPHSQLEALLDALLARRTVERVLSLSSGQVVLRTDSKGAPGALSMDEKELRHPLGPQSRLLLIGAGDLSAFLCEMALKLNFEVAVCDPRDAYRDSWPFPEIPVDTEMPDDFLAAQRLDTCTAVVTLTHDPKLDDLALIDALRSPAFYIGAIGSRRNQAKRRTRLQEHFSLSPDDVARLHGPAGLFIGSKTPAEIALSIMAEIVATRNGIRTGIQPEQP